MTRLDTSLISEHFGEVATWRPLSNLPSLIRRVLYDSQNAFTGAASFTLGTTHEVGVIIPVSQMGTLGVQRQVARPGCGHVAAAEVGEARVQPGAWPPAGRCRLCPLHPVPANSCPACSAFGTSTRP